MAYIYIASPYTIGDQAVNVRRSLLYADKLLSEGHIPFCPLLFHFWHYLSPKPYDEWVAISSAWVVKCNELHVLGGRSRGVLVEIEVARQLEIPVHYIGDY